MPRFSLIIPTQKRPDTLQHALRTAVEQTYDDIEIIVHESGDDERIADVVSTTADPRVRHVKTGSPVSMTENWERAVSCAVGDYLIVIGDDDALLRDACTQAAQILDRYPSEMLTWRTAHYFWPKCVVAPLQNRLQAHLQDLDRLEKQIPRTLLDLVYRFREHHYTLPMILHSFISKDVVRRVQDRAGAYFLSTAPDICSGVVNTFLAKSSLLYHRPLSLGGLSHHSTGSRLHFTRDASLRREAEESAFDRLGFHPDLVDSRNLHLFAANELLTVKERLFPDEPPVFALKSLLHATLQYIGSPGGSLADYEQSLADVRAIASRHGITIEESAVPAPPPPLPAHAQGVRAAGTDSLFIDVDCAKAGVTDVSEASRLLEALLPPFRAPAHLVEPPVLLRAVALDGSEPVVIDFSTEGTAALLLGSGWGPLESWGVWSLGPRAEVILPLDGRPPRRFQIRVDGALFVPPQRSHAAGSIHVNGRPVADFEATDSHPEVEVVFTVKGKWIRDEAVIEFVLDEAVSPASYGISEDNRSLGFGLKRIVITP